jgi:peptide/nickel transport system permease protein
VKNRRILLFRYARRNPMLLYGFGILFLLVFLWVAGRLYVSPDMAKALSVPHLKSPTLQYPLGTDPQGRNILAVMVVGVPLTLWIGFFAGAFGTIIGTILAFIAGYYRGLPDVIIRVTVDTLQTVPGLMILVVIALAIGSGGLSVTQMALVVGIVAWVGPTRTIRAQVLTMRERTYVEIARLSGMSGLKIIFVELIPNIMPFIVSQFVLSVAGGVLASIGLEALGLGPFDSNTLGMTLYWNIYYGSLIQGMWWWWGSPTAVIIMLFVGLFLVTAGLDEWANPRLRKQ